MIQKLYVHSLVIMEDYSQERLGNVERTHIAVNSAVIHMHFGHDAEGCSKIAVKLPTVYEYRLLPASCRSYQLISRLETKSACTYLSLALFDAFSKYINHSAV